MNKKTLKSEWNQDNRKDLSSMTEEEIKEFHKKLIDVVSKEYKIPKKYLDKNQNNNN
jgi:hypothetical protein